MLLNLWPLFQEEEAAEVAPSGGGGGWAAPWIAYPPPPPPRPTRWRIRITYGPATIRGQGVVKVRFSVSGEGRVVPAQGDPFEDQALELLLVGVLEIFD